MNKRESLSSQDSSLVKAIRDAYKSGEEDESLEPIVTVDASGQPVGRFKDGDFIIFYDIRGEREIQLTESLTDKGFAPFPIKKNFLSLIALNRPKT